MYINFETEQYYKFVSKSARRSNFTTTFIICCTMKIPRVDGLHRLHVNYTYRTSWFIKGEMIFKLRVFDVFYHYITLILRNYKIKRYKIIACEKGTIFLENAHVPIIPRCKHDHRTVKAEGFQIF